MEIGFCDWTLSEAVRNRISIVIITLAILNSSCNPPSNKSISIEWKDGQAIAINIPRSLFEGGDIDSISVSRDSVDVRILGEFKSSGSSIAFVPLIPLTRGLLYNIVYRGKIVSSVIIDVADVSEAAVAERIFPSVDTVPENLLKIYIKFSKPMRTVIASEHVFLLKDNGDTVENAFLDLDPPLWNDNKTMLTLWFDPGRIKRDLQPNLKLGAPMQEHNRYTVSIDTNWMDLKGLHLREIFKKQYVASARDSASPKPSLWTVNKPTRGTKEALKIVFHEVLDYSLLKDVFHLEDERSIAVKGEIIVEKKEGSISFIPSGPWNGIKYFLKVETRLEDLAGNNLNKPFDRDIKTVPDNEKKNGSEITVVITSK